MQTVLGSNGSVGKSLAKILPVYANDVSLVCRHPKKINEDDVLCIANLLNKDQTQRAIEGSKIAYLTVGLPYRTKLWKEEWPLIMSNVINACAMHKCKLVFLDNVYSYGKVKGWMTEQSTYKPLSQKGIVRAEIAEMLMEAVEKGKIEALIARAADFYGPATSASYLNIMVIENMIKGKKAQLLISDSFKHSWAYTPDLSNALAILGNTPEAYNQIWHLPTDNNVLSGKEIVNLCAEHLGLDDTPQYKVLSKQLIQLVGIFNHDVRETTEMLYQYSDDYLFDSSKFDDAFKIKKTSYSEGVLASIEDYLGGIN